MLKIPPTLIKKIGQGKKILLITFFSSSADNTSAAFALSELLKKLKKNVQVVIPEKIPENLLFIFPGFFIKNLRIIESSVTSEEKYLAELMGANETKDFDLVLYLSGSFFAIKKNSDQNYQKEKVILLAKKSNNPSKDNTSGKSFASFCEMVYHLYQVKRIKPDRINSKALYSGIVWATDGFKNKNTTPKTHKIIAELLGTGKFVPNEIFRKLFEEKPLERLFFIIQELKSAKLLFNKRVVFSQIKKKIFSKFGNDESIIKDIEEFLMFSKNTKIAVLFLETDNSRETRVIVICKNPFNAGKILSHYSPIGDNRKAEASLPFSVRKSKKLIHDVIETIVDKYPSQKEVLY